MQNCHVTLTSPTLTDGGGRGGEGRGRGDAGTFRSLLMRRVGFVVVVVVGGGGGGYGGGVGVFKKVHEMLTHNDASQKK